MQARLDRIHVLRTRLDSEAISPEEAEEGCKSRALVGQARKELKHDVAVRPVFHQVEERIEAPIFVSFIACCLPVSPKNIARPRAGGLTPRAIIEAFGTVRIVDVRLPTTDGRHLVLPRHARPRKEHELLPRQLGMTLPAQGAPRLAS